MTEGKKGKKQGGEQADIRAAISAFEQILEAMPNDRGSLEALYHAYERLGESEKSLEYLLRLGEALIAEHDVESASELLGVLQEHSDRPEAASLVKRIKELTGEGAEEGESLPQQQPVTSAGSDKVSYSFNMAEELSFVWKLLEANDLTQEEYSSVVQDLTEMSAGDAISTVSVLHVLEHRNFKNLEKIIVKASQDTNTPIVSLSSFDMPDEAGLLLSMDFMLRRGALIFGFVGDHPMVAIMNPYSSLLREDVQKLTAKTCHFFMCMPGEFDSALDKTMTVLAETENPEE
ncbi:MAG: hypothetical protein ACOC6C_02200 [Verrucomicrobiota bacterium]